MVMRSYKLKESGETSGIRRSRGEKVADVIINAVAVVLVAMIAYPLYFVIVASLSDASALYRVTFVFWPVGIQFDSYRRVLENENIWLGFRNSIFYTAVGTTINLIMTTLAAYPLSRRGFFGKGFITVMFTFTMFFSGGLIPSYLVNKSLGIVNKWMVMVLPGAISAYNVIIMRTFFQVTIPSELEESAIIDGCHDFRVLWSIVLPLSTPILSVMALFYGVGHWNSYFQALVYLTDRQLLPLQMILREILYQNQMKGMGDIQMIEQMKSDDYQKRQAIIEGLKYATVIISCLPILIIYPMLQKFFKKGILIGAIKG